MTATGAGLVAVAALSAGCATTAPTGGGAPAPVVATNPADPWEAWNRKVFAFNDAVDRAVLKPVAEAYRDVVPELVRTGVSNVLGNIGDVWSTANHFLQGKLQTGMEMGMRVLTNTVFGLGGLLDPASEMKLVRRPEDFGQTLGAWGLSPGPYMVLPLLGPSNVRDTGGFVVDRAAWSASSLPSDDGARFAVTALELVNTRAGLLTTTQLVGDVALDRYSFIRDAYLARRLDQVYDGAPPLEDFDTSGDEDPPPKK